MLGLHSDRIQIIHKGLLRPKQIYFDFPFHFQLRKTDLKPDSCQAGCPIEEWALTLTALSVVLCFQKCRFSKDKMLSTSRHKCKTCIVCQKYRKILSDHTQWTLLTQQKWKSEGWPLWGETWNQYSNGILSYIHSIQEWFLEFQKKL